jgi:hypothetical protein
MSFVAGEIKLNNSSIMTFGVGPDDKTAASILLTPTKRE